jgi:hypothetical protein
MSAKLTKGGRWLSRSVTEGSLLVCCYFLVPLIAAVFTAVTAGVLSPELAAQSENAFYDLSRSVNILGVMERIEPLVSAAMTMGVFCLLTGQLCAVRALIPGKYTAAAAAGLAAVAMFPAKSLPLPLLTAGNVLFWVLPTFVTLSLRGAKRRGNPFPPTDSGKNIHSPQGVESVKKDKK